MPTEYGNFAFEKTQASSEGTESRAICPFGMVDPNLQPILGYALEIKKFLDEKDTGAFRTCFLRNNSNGGIMSVWETPINRISHCRTSVSSYIATF